MTVGRRLHAGAVVDVYSGHAEDGTPVAVKLTNARVLGAPGAVALIAREHRMLAVLDHPHIVRALGFAARRGAAVLVLEHLPGGDLIPFAGESPRCWARAVLGIVAALRAVHAAGSVHGDVKARNVLFAEDGTAKLIDFGSAQAIGHRRGRGGNTPAHEPLRFVLENASPALDVYALAVLIYELLTGRLPFGPAPSGPRPVTPLDAEPVLRALADRVTAILSANCPADVGTLLELGDVLESVHEDAVRAAGRIALDE